MATSTLYGRFGAITSRLCVLIKPAGRLSLLARLAILALGAFFGTLTARVLLWEVHTVADLTVDHTLTIGAMVGAIASGVFFGPTLGSGKLLAAAGLAIAFMAGTAYCLIGSAGRADEAAFERNAAARQVNRDRDRAQRSRDEAKQRYETALAAETAECSGGAGRRCMGRRATTLERRSDMEVAELLLQGAKPEQRENGKLKRAAQVIALFTAVTEDGAERGLVILWPFLPPFICELLTIVFLHLGLGHRGVKRSTLDALPVAKPDLPEATATVARGVWVSVAGNRGATEHKSEAERDLLAYIAEYGHIPSQDFLAGRWRVNKGTVSRWLQCWEQQGLVSRHRDGKCKVVAQLKLN